MVNRGFTVLQLMFYITMLVCVISVSATLINSFYTTYLLNDKKMHKAYALTSAFNNIIKDLKQASAEKALWKKNESNYFITHINHDDIGWKITKKRLYRYAGIFNINTNKWFKRTVSLVMENCEEFNLDFEDQNYDSYAGVNFSLGPNSIYIKFKVGTYV